MKEEKQEKPKWPEGHLVRESIGVEFFITIPLLFIFYLFMDLL